MLQKPFMLKPNAYHISHTIMRVNTHAIHIIFMHQYFYKHMPYRIHHSLIASIYSFISMSSHLSHACIISHIYTICNQYQCHYTHAMSNSSHLYKPLPVILCFHHIAYRRYIYLFHINTISYQYPNMYHTLNYEYG